MAESALIEVFGPLADVERALLDMPELTGERRNRRNCLILDVGDDVSITVGDSDPTMIDLNSRGADVTNAAGEVYRGLATRVTFPMRLFDEADEIVQVRGAVPAD